MRKVWSEAYKRKLWREIWLALAEVQSEYGLVSIEQLDDLRKHAADIDMQRAQEIEADIHHDLMAELQVYTEQCPLGGSILHLGATSTDIEDNTDALRIRASLEITLDKLRRLLYELAAKIDKWAETPIIAFTHLQPAEPSTLGYRLAQYGQDLFMDWTAIARSRSEIRGKGFKGAVGTSAAFADLIGEDKLPEFEVKLADKLGLDFYPVTSQVYPRKQDYQVISALAGLGSSLYKFAFDLRLLQSPPIGEWAEPFSQKQVGSSAMPFKRNPVNSEKLNSLGRLLAQMPRVAWDNAAHSLLERTLDDSANRRTLLPEAFLAADEMLGTSLRIVNGIKINEAAIHHNLNTYAPFAATERVLVALSKAGGNRQEMHERLRQHSMEAWEEVQKGQPNMLFTRFCKDDVILKYLSPAQLEDLMDVRRHTGDSALRAHQMAQTIRSAITQE